MGGMAIMRADILLAFIENNKDVIATFNGPVPLSGENICVSVTRDDKTVRKWYRVVQREWRIDSTEMDCLGEPMTDNHVNLFVAPLNGKEWNDV